MGDLKVGIKKLRPTLTNDVFVNHDPYSKSQQRNSLTSWTPQVRKVSVFLYFRKCCAQRAT